MDRWQWVDAFREANINTATLMNMSEEDFKRCCTFLVDSGIAPLSYLKPKKTKEEEELDKIIEESKKLKSQRDNGGYSGYRYTGESSINDKKYNMNNNEEFKEEEEHTNTKKENDLGPKCYVWDDDNENESNRVAKNQQEDAYNRLLEEQLRIQAEEEKQHVEEMKRNLQEHNKEANATYEKREAIEKLQFLGPEPLKGVQLALQMPTNKRILRKFDVDKEADDVFTVVEGQEDMYDNKDSLPEYYISYGFNQHLERGKTLREQGITRKTLLNVIIE